LSVPAKAKSKMERIPAPHVGILGTSVAERYYQCFTGADVIDGGINRCLVFGSTRQRRRQTPRVDLQHVSEEIKRGLLAIRGGVAMTKRLEADDGRLPNYPRLSWGAGAEEVWSQLADKAYEVSEATPELAPFLARTAENAVRLATVLAIGD